MDRPWTRRAWLRRSTAAVATTAIAGRGLPRARGTVRRRPARGAGLVAQHDRQCAPLDPGPWQALAQQVVDAARTAGAQYADVRLTRTVGHDYVFGTWGTELDAATELVGLGVRALVHGYWGFAACPWRTPDDGARVAREAVAQAKVNAHGLPRTVELGPPVVTKGSWATPIRLDPFRVPIEEKLDFMRSWVDLSLSDNVPILNYDGTLQVVRRERVVATSEGSLFTQTLLDTGGSIKGTLTGYWGEYQMKSGFITGLQVVGKGWEVVQEADIPAQLSTLGETVIDQINQKHRFPLRLATVGRYTIVCDGPTMAAMLDATLGVATQLDVAMGYEANASGTSYLDDPLAMVGQLPVAAPLVTVTGNRTAPTQLATVKWDDEGVECPPFPLVKAGVLVDFQTTREQAGWLAAYYTKQGRPVRSNGCAASESALVPMLQQRPNLALEPGPATLRVEDLVAQVPDGIFIENGVVSADFQARTGLLESTAMRRIKDGKLVSYLTRGGIRFNSLDFWKNVIAVGGPSTTGGIAQPADDFLLGGHGRGKGEPAQGTGRSVRAAAATIKAQSLVNPMG